MLDGQTTTKQLDSTIEIVAPENVAFVYRAAGPFVRATAFAIDAAIIGVYVVAFGLGCVVVGSVLRDWNLDSEIVEQFLTAAFLLNYLFAFWFWNAAFEAFGRGRTLGKAAMRLRVLTIDGRPIGRGQALLRNVVRTADLALGPFVAAVFASNDRMARLGDLAAGTLVVVEERNRKKRASLFFKQPEILKIVADIPFDFDVSDSLRKALALYVARRTQISPARRLEIAAPLSAVLLEKANFPYRVNPDAFLCALYQRSLGDRGDAAAEISAENSAASTTTNARRDGAFQKI